MLFTKEYMFSIIVQEYLTVRCLPHLRSYEQGGGNSNAKERYAYINPSIFYLFINYYLIGIDYKNIDTLILLY